MSFDFDAVAARHVPDEVDGGCAACSQELPCDAVQALDVIRERDETIAQALGLIRELRQVLGYCAQPTGWDRNAVEALRVSMYAAKNVLEGEEP